MSKLKDGQSCIIDAQYLADIIEIAADGLETPEGGAISGVARIAIEKLTEAIKLLDQAEAEAQAVNRQAILSRFRPVKSRPCYDAASNHQADALHHGGKSRGIVAGREAHSV
jgi:hypothetical protein